jgi:hypothetical protein
MPGTLSNLPRFGNKKTAAEAFESPPKAFNRRVRAQDCTVFAHNSIQPKTLAGGRILYAAWRKTKLKIALKPH